MKNKKVDQKIDSQNSRLLKYIINNEYVDRAIAFNQLFIYRLSARIFDLRDKGHDIEVIKQDETPLARYRLKKSAASSE